MRRVAGPPFLLSYGKTRRIRVTGAQGLPVTRMTKSDSTTLRGPAAVVRLRRHIVDRADLEARGLERTDSRLAAGARSLDEDVDLLHAVLLRLARGRLGGELRGVGGRLARALEAHGARRGPADDSARGVGDGDDRVVERRLDVGLAHRDVLLLLAARLARGGLRSSHYFLPAFFLPATVRFGPLRVRALVLVR